MNISKLISVNKEKGFDCLENIFALMPGIVYWKNREGKILGCNNNFLNVFDLTSIDNFKEKVRRDDLSKKYLNRLMQYDQDVLTSGIAKLNEEVSITLDQQKKIYLIDKIPLKDNLGKVSGLLSVSLDITGHHRKLMELISELSGNIYWLNKQGVFLGCNKNMLDMLGLESEDEYIGKTYCDLYENKHIKIIQETDQKVMQTDSPIIIDEKAVRKDGTVVFYLTEKKPLHDEQGKVYGLLGVSIDITERKEMEIALKASKQKAEEASELKSQFMMNMQHDLRTPASGVAAMLEILANKEIDSDKKETLEEVADSSRKLLNILNAILEFDSVEKGSLPVLSEKFNLHDVIKDVEALEAPTATLKHLDIRTHVDDRLPKELIGDPFRVQRVLINLLSNAIKFTASGYVEIDEILWEHVDDRNVLVQIIVKDTGMGIPKAKQKVIFERFTRLDPSNKGIHEGLGLGLSMVKQFVEEMNGSIEIKSSPGQGTTFICTLPFKLPESAKEVEGAKVLSESISSGDMIDIHELSSKILLVEDDKIAQLVGKSLLADEFHAQLDVATTGKEAVDLVKRSKTPYDLIFMDIGLPDGSGCKFTKQIHEISENTAKIPIVALTAHDSDKTKQDCRVCGMQDYITKPLGVLKMDRIFQKWLHQTVDHGKKEENKNIEEDKIVDLELGAKLVGGDVNKAKEMLKFLIDMLPDYEKQLEENFKNGGLEELKNIAHKLKGATAYCGAPRLKEAAKALEEKIRLDDNLKKDEIEPVYKNLLKEINNLEKAFKEI